MEPEPRTCPKCGQKGSLQTKMVRNDYGAEYYYEYFAHYGGRVGSRTKVTWHYVGKKAPATKKH